MSLTNFTFNHEIYRMMDELRGMMSEYDNIFQMWVGGDFSGTVQLVTLNTKAGYALSECVPCEWDGVEWAKLTSP